MIPVKECCFDSAVATIVRADDDSKNCYHSFAHVRHPAKYYQHSTDSALHNYHRSGVFLPIFEMRILRLAQVKSCAQALPEEQRVPDTCIPHAPTCYFILLCEMSIKDMPMECNQRNLRYRKSQDHGTLRTCPGNKKKTRTSAKM